VRSQYLPVVAVLFLAPRPAAGDRVVGPVDRLSAWTVEIGSALSWLDRTVEVTSADGPSAGEGREVAMTPWLRIWPTDWLEVDLRQPIALDRVSAQGGVDQELDRSAMHDVELGASMLVSRGSFAGGSGLQAVLPSGGWNFSSERFALTASALAAWRAVSGGHLYARPGYTARAGDDQVDAVSLEVGLAQRLGPVSLVPRATVERSLTLLERGDAIGDAFTTWRAAITAAVEVAPDLTASLGVDWASAGAHAISDGSYARASEVVTTAGLVYAWDLGDRRDSAGRVPDPAAIHLADARIGARPAPADRLRELRHLVPRLRLATLDAERAAGGARGEMVVRYSGDVVEVDDRVGAPALARAVADFYQRALPGWARTADRVEITLCFDRCADARL
jgi:hypothetical protein